MTFKNREHAAEYLVERLRHLRGTHPLVLGIPRGGVPMARVLADALDGDLDVVLVRKLRAYGSVAPTAGSDSPDGFDLVINATPMGMRAGDPLPIRVDLLAPSTFVGDVVTVPAVPPLIERARAVGCRTMIGATMFEAVRNRMVDFLLESTPVPATD